MPSRRSRRVAGTAVISSHSLNVTGSRKVVPDLCGLRALSGQWPPTRSRSSRCSSARSLPRADGVACARSPLCGSELDAARAGARRPRAAEGQTLHVDRAPARHLAPGRASPVPRPRARRRAAPTLSARRARRAGARARGGDAARLAQHRRRASAARARRRGALQLDVDAARRSFAPPAINASAPTGLHPRCTRGCVRGAGRCRLDHLLQRRARGPAARDDCSTASAAAHSSSLLTVAQLRTVAVPADARLAEQPSSACEFCMPSGHHT